MEVKVEVLGREVIKPASRAPQDRLQLSIVDHSCPAIYVSPIFFFKTLAGESSEIISWRLKSSLSETLSRFYPLAGRIDGLSISCNDEGAVFTEARTDLLLSDFLKNNLSNTDSLGEFIPKTEPGESAGTWPLLSVMVTFFGSRSGVAVTVAVSHKICDAASLVTFVSGWAAATASDVAVTTPQFAGATVYPAPHSSDPFSSIDELFELKGKCVTNRFVFRSLKIDELKLKAASESVPAPTRVEGIASLIWRCARNASRSNSVSPKPTMMIQSMDLRLRVPANVLSRDVMGNIQSAFFIKEDAESEMELGEIVAEFRKGKESVNEMIQENLKGGGTITTIGHNLLSVVGNLMAELKPGIDVYTMSSWCKKPFYEVDFGWGTPVWIGSGSHDENLVFVFLVDSKDGQDVEAWVGLPEQDMALFVRDQHLLNYADVNPPVLI